MLFWFTLCFLWAFVRSIPIDNGLKEEPEVVCGPRSVSVNFNTEKAFNGNIYVKNHFADEDCKAKGGGRTEDGIELSFDTCGVRRERSVNPRGIFVSATVIISFHPVFLTKIDRAIRFECFYMEADKTVSQELEVSMLTTEEQTITVPMPVCRYEILEGGPDGDPIRFTIIGQQVYHKWTCDTETTDTFCMIVYDCFVNDGAGDEIQLLNDAGCALDKFLLNNLEYPTDLMAGREAHVFKYADRANLYFNCQIRITIKEPGSVCPRPSCPVLRKRRNVPIEVEGAVVDVSVPHLSVADVDMQEELFDYHPRSRVITETVCVGSAAMTLTAVLVGVIVLLSFVAFCFCYGRRK